MLFGRRKPGFCDETVIEDPEQAVLSLQQAEMAAKKKPKADSFDLDRAIEAAHRASEKGASVESAKQDMNAEPAAEDGGTAANADAGAPAGPELFAFLAAQPEARGDEFADMPTTSAPPPPQLTPAQQLAGYIRARSEAAQVTSLTALRAEVENADALLEEMKADVACTDIVCRTGAKDTYYYANSNMSDNYAMIASLIEDKDLAATIAQMVRFNAKTYPCATPFAYFSRSPYGCTKDEIEAAWAAMQKDEAYADIEELTNNENTRFLFSTKFLTRRYATAISNIDEFCD